MVSAVAAHCTSAYARTQRIIKVLLCLARPHSMPASSVAWVEESDTYICNTDTIFVMHGPYISSTVFHWRVGRHFPYSMISVTEKLLVHVTFWSMCHVSSAKFVRKTWGSWYPWTGATEPDRSYHNEHSLTHATKICDGRNLFTIQLTSR